MKNLKLLYKLVSDTEFIYILYAFCGIMIMVGIVIFGVNELAFIISSILIMWSFLFLICLLFLYLIEDIIRRYK